MTSKTTGYIDLHEKTTKEAMGEFIEYYNHRVAAGNLSEIEVQHGWGSTGEGGRKICNRLRRFLSDYPDQVSFVCSCDQLDHYDSKTFVYPKKRLPTEENLLADSIIDYCETPKTEEKILGKFRRFGDPKIRKTINELCSQGILEEKIKNYIYKVYVQSSNP